MTDHETLPTQSPGNRAPRILLVDDDPQLIQVFAAWLHDEGFETDLAYDGMQALAIIADIEPDLVVADVSMPLMDGVALAERLKRRNIPVILISANALPAATDPTIPFLRKPFDLTEFVTVVRRQLMDRS
ncbi:MAG: response regulator [Thermomicrobiales bacterium]|nr:response regulator [Thermomicrobiales bacterium]